MRKIKVLVVDDSAVVRHGLLNALEDSQRISVVGMAENGRVALEQMDNLQPDIVLLDIEMPEMDGLETLKALRKKYHRLPVLVLSSVTQRGAMVTIEALSRGATDYLPKPTTLSRGNDLGQAQTDIVDKIVALTARALQAEVGTAPTIAAPRPRLQAATHVIDLVAIGISTGGPRALTELFGDLPGDFPVPIVIVQHMPPVFTKQLAKSLDSRTHLCVREAHGGEVLQTGDVWIAPGNHHLTVATGETGKKQVLQVSQGNPVNSCRPSVDVLFDSVAAVYQHRALGVVMTGMGQDGLEGSKRMRAHGANIVAQDEATSVVWGMAGYVATLGVATDVVPLDGMAPTLLRYAKVGRMARNET